MTAEERRAMIAAANRGQRIVVAKEKKPVKRGKTVEIGRKEEDGEQSKPDSPPVPIIEEPVEERPNTSAITGGLGAKIKTTH